MLPDQRFQILEDTEAVAAEAAARILATAAACRDQHHDFHLVLAGGRTPQRCYRRISEAAPVLRHWHLWYGDERCLPPTHPERNHRLILTAGWPQLGLLPANHHRIPAELGPEAGARAYARQIAARPDFDLGLLGLGEDGHCASLFPDRDPASQAGEVIAVHDAPKPPPERISLGISALARCRRLLLLITGAGKHQALLRLRHGPELPLHRLDALRPLQILCDRAAWDE